MSSELYILFGGHKGYEGGAYDFMGAYDTFEEARDAALQSDIVQDSRLSTQVHMALLKGKRMTLFAKLNIPGTEYDETGELGWTDY